MASSGRQLLPPGLEEGGWSEGPDASPVLAPSSIALGVPPWGCCGVGGAAAGLCPLPQPWLQVRALAPGAKVGCRQMEKEWRGHRVSQGRGVGLTPSSKHSELGPVMLLQLGGVSFFQNLKIQRSVGRARDGTTFPLSLKLKSEPSGGEAEGRPAYRASVWVFSTVSGLITLLPDGTIYGINHSFALALFGYGKTELLGKVRSGLPECVPCREAGLLRPRGGVLVLRLVPPRLWSSRAPPARLHVLLWARIQCSVSLWAFSRAPGICCMRPAAPGEACPHLL